MQVLFFFRASDFPVFLFLKLVKTFFRWLGTIAVAALFPKKYAISCFAAFPAFVKLYQRCGAASQPRSLLIRRNNPGSPL